MSPALIDTPPPPTQQQSSLLQNPNPKSRGNFDFTSNDFLSEHQIDSKFGNLGINEGNFSSRKPLSSGLSMPRFAKVRRNKGRSTTTSFEGGVDNESGMRDLRDRWNPFAASDKGFGSGSDDLGRGNAGFVFGGSSLSKEKNGVGENEGEVLLDELKKLNIGGSVKDDPFLGNVEFGKSSAGFVFGGSNSNVEKNGVGESEGKLSLHDEMMKLNIESSKNGETVEKASEINTFAFGKGSDSEFVFGLSNSNTEKTRIREKEDQSSSLPNEMTKLNIESSKNGEKAVKNKDASFNSKADDKSTFLFGQSSNAANRTSYGSSDSKLPDELKKLNIEDTTTAGNFNFMSNANNSFIFGSSKMNDDSTLGGSATTLADKLGKIKIYGHGTVEKVKKTSAFGSDKYDSNVCATNILPGERTKLKFGSTIEVSDGFPDTQFGNRTEELFNAPAFGGSIPSVCTSSTPMASGGSRVDPLFSVQLNNDSKLDTSFSSSSTFSFGFDIPSDEIKSRVSFTSTVSQSGTSHADFGKSSQDASGYLFTGLNQKMDFSAKRGGAKGTRLKKRQEKMRQPASGHHVVKDRSSQENPESPTCYSPMDFSPYQETLAADLNSRETSVASEISGDAIDEDLITATHSLNNNKDIQKGRNSSEESTTCFEKDDSANCPDEFVSGSRSECLNPNTEKVGIETYPQAGIPSNIKNEGSDGILQFSFASSSQDDRDTKFTFASSSTTSAQGNLSAAKRHYKKKNRTKSGLDSHSNAKVQLEIPCIPFVPFASSSPSSAPGQDQKEDPFKSHNIPVNKSKSDKEPEVVKQGTISSAAAVAAVQELCDKWRFRGNQAYANGNLSKAEDYYTRGVNCVLSDEISKSCLSALVLCYSNRAAARMSAGRMREALDDCARAAEIDSTFLRVQVRAAK
ncbi:hypothetical protein GIB67_039661 [Kingdonia uniflora]|uniref:Uncharacterized protein n=1 Tax=Kingdonia uniflora TaxID=39325 RepID=A0A7J7MDW1_9MAGN|nr:hypothetical protein GIB67_039661 [Kingdonia uniflora]